MKAILNGMINIEEKRIITTNTKNKHRSEKSSETQQTKIAHAMANKVGVTAVRNNLREVYRTTGLIALLDEQPIPNKNLLTTTEEKLFRWQEYYQEMFRSGVETRAKEEEWKEENSYLG